MPNRGGYAYEATTLQGNIIFTGGASCAAISVHGAIQEAIVEALLKATSLGYKQILILIDCKRLIQVSNGETFPTWKEKIMLTNLQRECAKQHSDEGVYRKL